jgi:hypothetical protein
MDFKLTKLLSSNSLHDPDRPALPLLHEFSREILSARDSPEPGQGPTSHNDRSTTVPSCLVKDFLARARLLVYRIRELSG